MQLLWARVAPFGRETRQETEGLLVGCITRSLALSLPARRLGDFPAAETLLVGRHRRLVLAGAGAPAL